MNILFITRAHGEHAGGMERLSFELAQALKNEPGVHVQVLAYHGPRLLSPIFNFFVVPRALQAARTADAVHLGDPVLSFTGWFIKKITKKPVVMTVHGLDILHPNFFYQMYLRLFLKSADFYFPISSHVEKILQQKHPRAKSAVLTPAVNDNNYDSSLTRAQLADLLKRDITAQKVLFTNGRLVKRKGHAWFIQKVLPHLPANTLYVIAGDGPERGSLKAGAASAGLKDRVLMLGRVKDADLRLLYNTVDAFIMPNIQVEGDVEGFGLVLLEAALCNRPVFAANLEGIPDAIESGRNGQLLPSGSAQIWINKLTDFLSASSLPAVSARQFTLEKYNWQKQAAIYRDILKSVFPV